MCSSFWPVVGPQMLEARSQCELHLITTRLRRWWAPCQLWDCLLDTVNALVSTTRTHLCTFILLSRDAVTISVPMWCIHLYSTVTAVRASSMVPRKVMLVCQPFDLSTTFSQTEPTQQLLHGFSWSHGTDILTMKNTFCDLTHEAPLFQHGNTLVYN